MGFPVCCRSPSEVFAATSGFLRLYAVCFKENGETAVAVANATVPEQVNVQRFKYIGRPELAVGQWVI